MSSTKTTEYRLVKDVLSIQEEPVITYGIAVSIDGVEQQCIRDISLHEDSVQRAVADFNRYHLSPCHFIDAIDDLLVD